IAAGDSYGIVLILIVLALAVGVMTPETAFVLAIEILVQAVTLLVTFKASLVSPRVMRIAALVVGLGTLLALVLLVTGAFEESRAIARSFEAVLAFVAPVVILQRLVRHYEVTGETVLGALCVYLLIGLVFANIYAVVETLGGTPFFAQIEDAAFADFVYFSYVTQATVGYGDLTAVTTPGRMLAVANGLLGQIYLVTVVAIIVGNLGRSRPSAAEAATKE
ncbi:MAG TPA: potassium channel family protein, partial [Thermoleophilia bacterium]|nr:potassium channel family protein [Thermoleophilia bacterium]